jgi:hypothetical protein
MNRLPLHHQVFIWDIIKLCCPATAYVETDSETEEATEKRREWDHMQSSLLRLHVQMLNYALEKGYADRWWRTVVNTILFKDP